MRNTAILCALSALFLFSPTHSALAQSAADQPVVKAVAVIYPTAGNKVTGVVSFLKVPDGVEVVADLNGLTPGPHGFHVHQYGDCSAANGDSAGGHFNPEGMPHAAPTSKERHEGDLGNITADKDGKAHYDWTDNLMTLEGRDSIIGRSVIVHANPDDLVSQPAGNSGPKVACGVIGIGAK